MSSQPYISFVGVSKSYDGLQSVVDGLDLDIARGEFVSLLGPSGSGKATTLMMLAGFETPTDGSILLDGRRLDDKLPHQRDIGMVFQNYALFPHMTIAENVAFPLSVRKVDRAEQKARTLRALEMVELSHLAARRPAQLSGGQQQRVALARAGVRAERGADGRAARRARQAAARNHAVRNHAAASRTGADDRLRHARSGRGADDVEPRRGVLRRTHPAGRLAHRTLRRRAERVRRELRRREQRPDGARGRHRRQHRHARAGRRHHDSRPLRRRGRRW